MADTPRKIGAAIADAGALIGDEREGVIATAADCIRQERARHARTLRLLRDAKTALSNHAPIRHARLLDRIDRYLADAT